ncbi:putative adenosine deaminase acting on tRNA [Danaus plexippus plexippus]|uniref:tRNA-specific adenosine deaminase 1 n=1 Tax=Danaus plexippus plexippus TaxID=278856 RepID=A0A212FGC7_DANPL|nr:putative adenosine deaminase acting on tRNA [Danaus plexippus plexippus]
MSSLGNILNDSHAEIIARRGFLLYLYKNILDTLNEKSSIFIRENEKFKLKDNLEYLFYSSQMPCGDASIIPKCGEQDDYGDLIINSKRKADINICEIQSKKVKMDIHRTGAKCLTHRNQDPKEPGDKYHLIGQVRTKPGRGDRTLSVSCSDKIARWIHLGIQGALLSLILHEPIFIKCFIFGSGTPYSKESLNRALIYRDNEDVLGRLQVVPEFHNSSIVFPHIRTTNSLRPSAGSIIYVNINNGLQEVAVQGVKLGLTKKRANSLNHCLSICKYSLYRIFLEILEKNHDLKKIICCEELKDIPYNKMKRKAILYQEKWTEIKDNFFKAWTVKPDIWNFCINDK